MSFREIIETPNGYKVPTGYKTYVECTWKKVPCRVEWHHWNVYTGKRPYADITFDIKGCKLPPPPWTETIKAKAEPEYYYCFVTNHSNVIRKINQARKKAMQGFIDEGYVHMFLAAVDFVLKGGATAIPIALKTAIEAHVVWINFKREIDAIKLECRCCCLSKPIPPTEPKKKIPKVPSIPTPKKTPGPITPIPTPGEPSVPIIPIEPWFRNYGYAPLAYPLYGYLPMTHWISIAK